MNNPENNKLTRRQVISGIGAGMATLAISPALSAAEVASSNLTLGKLEDPVSKYPKPPFKEQKQPWPGLAGKMEPQPDHGEKTYKVLVD